MSGFVKFLVGGAAASLLAWGAHQLSGSDYIDGLEADGQAALSGEGLEGASLSMSRDPLSRAAVLDGITDPEARARAEAAALAVPGISAVRWADGNDAAGNAVGGGDGTDGAGGANEPDSATVAAVSACQGDVDAVMEGKTITFRSGSAYLNAASLRIVDDLATALSECENMSVAVGGHTDATGSAEINQSISQARADAVAAALSERGVGADRITATGFGSSEPKIAGDGANPANRRIEFTLSAGADNSTGGE
ncbi:MAG: OmpA family protein [Erythrobacter sp.]